jgi:peptide/nickel transport system permease protein
MDSIKRVLKNPLGATGVAIILFWAIIALMAPVLAKPKNPDNPYAIKRVGYSALPTPPSQKSILGTTGGGYDIFYGMVWGARTSFKIGLTVVACTFVIGVALGGTGAYIGGTCDMIIMRITDLFMSFPFLIAVIIVSIVLGKGQDKVILAMIVFGWRQYARIMRSEVLSVKNKDFVMAARSIGVDESKIFLFHVLPNSIFPVFVIAFIDIGVTALAAASMSFIGIGAEPGYADWGQMITFSKNWLLGIEGDPLHYWYTYTYPSIAIVSFILGWTLLGDTLRDVLDPKLRRKGTKKIESN